MLLWGLLCGRGGYVQSVKGKCQFMRELTLTQREQTRLQVLNRLVAQQLTTRESAAILGLSERHTWRMLAAYRKEGAAAPSPREQGVSASQRRCRGDTKEGNRPGTHAVPGLQSHPSGRDDCGEGRCGAESFHREEHPTERGVAQSAIPAAAAPPAQASTDAPGGDAPPARW